MHTMTWHVCTKSAHMHMGIEFLGSSTHVGEERVKKKMKIQQKEKYDEPKIQHNKLIFPLKKNPKKKQNKTLSLSPLCGFTTLVFFSQSNNTNN